MGKTIKATKTEPQEKPLNLTPQKRVMSDAYYEALTAQIRYENTANRDAAKHGGYSRRYGKSL